ncbi:hypothetical protein GCM10027418_04900 [Mariniluteicoccus endophyticus]
MTTTPLPVDSTDTTLDRRQDMALYRGTTSDDGHTLHLTIETRRRTPIDAKNAADLDDPAGYEWLVVATHPLTRPTGKPAHPKAGWVLNPPVSSRHRAM